MYMIFIIYTSRHWKVMASHWTIKLGHTNGWPQQKLPKFGFHTRRTVLCSMEVFHSVCQVWLSSGPPECFTFCCCAWLWNWLLTNVSRVLAAWSAWSAFRVLFTWSRRTTCAKDHRLFKNLNLTHKLTRLENPITGMDLVSATDLKGAQPRSRIGQSLWSFYILPWRCSFLRLV